MWLSSVQFSSVTQSCPTLCDPMNCSMPGLPVHHQPSHPLSSPLSSGSFPVSLFFTSGGQSTGVSASALVLLIQYWFLLGLTGLIFLQSKELSKVFSNTTIQKHQFIDTQLSLQSNLTSINDYWKRKPIALTRLTLSARENPLLTLLKIQISNINLRCFVP